MIDIVRECEKIVRTQRAAISRLNTTHVNRDDVKADVRGLVDAYFRTDRPIILEDLRDESVLASVDSLMQELLRLTQGRSLRKRYLDVLGALQRAWQEVEIRGLPVARKLTGEDPFKDHQHAILATLEQICPASGRSYRQALTDLGDRNRSSWRGSASELRESLRELLDKLAPDDAVISSPGFKLEDGAKGPTMRQKARFILRSRRQSESERKPVEEAAGIVEESVSAFVRTAYTRSSVSVHTEPSRKDVVSVLRLVELAFAELLELEG